MNTKVHFRTDAAILYVPMPLLWELRVPLRQKFAIGLLLSSGIFVISAAILRVASTLAANPSALTINRWGVRETIVGIIAVNLPISPPLFRKSFWRNGRIKYIKRNGGLIAPVAQWPRAPAALRPYQIPAGNAGTFAGTDYANTITAVTTHPARSFYSSQQNIISQDEGENGEQAESQRHVFVSRTFEVRTETAVKAQMKEKPKW